MSRKLGRLPHDPARIARMVQLRDHMRVAPANVSCDWTANMDPTVPWGLFLNNEIGDCTAAGMAHALTTWGCYVPPFTMISDNQVLRLYQETGGYVPGNEATDNGAVCQDVIDYCSRVPLDDGAKIIGAAAVNPHDVQRVRAAIYNFGGLYVGVTLRVAQQAQKVWDVGGDQHIWGGHCVWVPVCDDDGLTCISWGEKIRMTWPFWAASCDEAHALVSPRWIDETGKTPTGLTVNDLIADLKGQGAST